MLSNQRGMAVFEIIPILVIFVLLLNFALGFFGAIHSGILGSIAARNYAFETFRNRANLNYLRDAPTSELIYYSNFGYRYHGNVSEPTPQRPAGDEWVATKRNIKFSESQNVPPLKRQDQVHSTKVPLIQTSQKASNVITNPDDFDSVWVRIVYGICINSLCGDTT